MDADSGLMNTVMGTAANVNDVTQAAKLLHGKEEYAWGDAGYQGVDKRQEMQGSKTKAKIKWHVAMRPGKRKTLNANLDLHKLLDKAERRKAKVEHPLPVIKQQFAYAKVRSRPCQEHEASAECQTDAKKRIAKASGEPALSIRLHQFGEWGSQMAWTSPPTPPSACYPIQGRAWR